MASLYEARAAADMLGIHLRLPNTCIDALFRVAHRVSMRFVQKPYKFVILWRATWVLYTDSG